MPKLWPAALGLLAALFAVFQFGYLCSRSEIGDLEADLTNARQREQALLARLADLQTQLGGESGFGRAEHAESTEAEAEAATRDLEETIARLETEKRAAERARDAAKRERDAARREKQTAERARSKLASEKTRLEGELAGLRERTATSLAAAPKPAASGVASSSPPAKPAASSSRCPALERAEFAILETATPLSRFGGRLRLEVEAQGADLVLRVGGSRYLLEQPPQRFSFDCAGTPYMVSVCEITREPLAVVGKITPADAWQGACR